MNEEITLGSLFDGIGAIPYAASFFGIKTLWASEILPNAISITKRHFPGMEHLGDITKLNGGKIPPVRILAFGSPCQSWSVAGDRSGFSGKSGLFTEAIRIIYEMRKATNGKSPEIVLFENVVGLLSGKSGGHAGSDYKTVLEAFCQAEIPMPESGRWATAGMVRGRGVDLAWIVKDAQYHRTAQRRKRLFALVDFAGQRAGEILFVTKSLSGYFAARERERERAAADFEGGAGITGAGVDEVRGAFMAGQAKNARSIAYSETVSPTLKGSSSGLNQMPCICEPQIARTLTARGDSSPCADRGQNIIAEAVFAETHPDVAGTLCSSGAGLSRTAGMASETDLCVAYALQGNMIGRQDKHGPRGSGVNKEVCFSLTAADKHGVAAIDCRNLSESAVSGTIQSKSTGGYSLNYQNPLRVGYVCRRLTPTEAERLMSLPDDWTKYGRDGKLMSDSARYSMCGNSIVVNVLAYIMRNIAEKLSNNTEG
ncbi:MAG: DNA cytosine methyltransferase [Clostridiales bacterium]|nr:DNA cytosine methyltransferase [Clostridiales bacterium]